jgi:hypothetical protein
VKNAVFWDVTPFGSYKNRRFRDMYRLYYQDERIGELGTTLAVNSNRRVVFLRRVRRSLVTANEVPSSPTLVALIIETMRSSEISVLTRATRR